MKSLVVFALLLGVAATSSAQVPSHGSTGVTESSTVVPSASPFQVGDRPVAQVNSAILTDRDLLREMLQIFPYARQHNGFPKGQEASIRQGALQMIIFEELVYQEAVRRKLTVPTQELKRSEADFKQQFHSAEEYRQYLIVEMGGSEQNMRDRIRRSLLIEQILKSDVEVKSAVSVADAKAYYENNGAKFQVPESFAFQSISMLPPRNANAEQRKEVLKKAEDALKAAKATSGYEDFGLLAEKISEDDFRVNMGDHKVVGKVKLPPQVVKALLTMKLGGVSDLIQIEQAYTIVRLNAHTPSRERSFGEVRNGLRADLQKAKYEQLRTALDKRLRANANVKVL